MKLQKSKYNKKLYAISIRSKISPQIMHLKKDHNNFDKEENIEHRRKICDLLRQDSQLDNVHLIHRAGGDIHESGKDNQVNPIPDDFDFSDDESEGLG